MGPLHALTAIEMLDAYRSGAVSPVEVTRDVLARIERWEPLIAATWALDADAALDAARASEARWRRGEPLALDGVPVTIKENIATRGVPVPLGTAASELVPATADAPPAARLREAGAVILAKTTMPDYGMLTSGLSSFHKLARNPWNLALNPGGSSAGAGAAGAAGYGPIHLGTDIGGSIRLPACWCGLVGFKPSFGRVPIQPTTLGRVAGPMTRTVRDAALAMRVLAQPDGRDPMSLPAQPLAWLDDDAPLALKGLRLGVLLDGGWGLPLDAEVRAVVEAAARRFEAAGAIVEPLAPFTTPTMAAGIDRWFRLRTLVDLRALPAGRRSRVLPFIAAWAEGAAGVSAEDAYRAFAQWQALREAGVAACGGFDFVLSPVSPTSGFPAEWAMPSNDPARSLDHIAFTLPFNVGEQPAISVDAGHAANGLPVGLQIAGRRFDDLGVLRMAAAWEALRPAPRPWPQPPG
ncbi:MAG TPA: amidase [Methylibium sp.]|uniref:amidase n=1 Tax=Methylibium sp. TaxID=2067992 RepID=UPI002DB800A6|nr:amidase [Methylibium sp.]HEU4458483.1 amidase [Methylibium sp.]